MITYYYLLLLVLWAEGTKSGCSCSRFFCCCSQTVSESRVISKASLTMTVTGVSAKPSSLTSLTIDRGYGRNLRGGCWLEHLHATSPFDLGFLTLWQLGIKL